jgi:CRISPR-associated protein Cst2
MPFITGLMLIDAPASALNNSDEKGGNQETMVKRINVRGQGVYVYVSAQAKRYWLRTTLEREYAKDWQASPIYTAEAGKKQQAYTAGDPITYADDDLFGYMRAVKEETVTRVSPLRTSTLVSLAPASVVDDFGVMARAEKKEGDKEGVLLHGHQFYRTVLVSLFSLDLRQAGRFTNQYRTGFQNLGKKEQELAKSRLKYVEDLKAYELPIEERVRRVQVLLRAMGRLEGGAKQTLHYTDVSPAFVMMAVTRGGNHAFGRVVKAENGAPVINQDALAQVERVFSQDLLSGVYVGRAAGFMDSEQTVLEGFGLNVQHPREAFDALANDLANNPDWMS